MIRASGITGIIPQRYIRQIAFSGMGESGQQILGNSRVVIVGAGALGTVSANCRHALGLGFCDSLIKITSNE